MIRHIVLVRLKEEATAAQVAAWKAAAVRMCEASSEVLSHSFGQNVGSGPNHYDWGLVADFRDMESFRAYISGAGHQAYVAEHARVVVDQLAAIQHEV